MDFDAIVVGSGITGGLAAKELTEAGLKVLMIERGQLLFAALYVMLSLGLGVTGLVLGLNLMRLPG